MSIIARRLAVMPLVWCLIAPLTVLALGTGVQVDTPDSSAPTAVEQALIEHQCAATPVADPSAHEECLAAQLLSLRTDFGHDLSKLSRSERRAIDAACSKTPSVQDRDAYVACLNGQLIALRERWLRAHPPPPDAPAPAPSATDPSSVPAAQDVPAAGASARHRWAPALWIGGAVVVLFAAAGGVLLARTRRTAPRACNVCGEPLSDPGDMCQKCRHEAADALRQAAAERADQARANEEQQRLLVEQEAELRELAARREEEALQQQEQQARDLQRAREEDDARLREEEALQRRQLGVATEEELDPHAILGVAHGASQEEIRAAYEEAKAKYDLDMVSHLGEELQQHFKTKAKAVEEAYAALKEE